MELGVAAADVRIPQAAPGVAGIERLREGGEERQGMIPLDRNERLAPLPDAVIEELRSGITSDMLTVYPSLDATYAALSEATGVARESLLLTAGSDAAFKSLHQCYVSPGDRTVMLAPTYAMYDVYGRMFQADVAAIAFEEDMSLDHRRLLDAIAPGTRLVLLANPNQPTGTTLPREAIEQVLERAAEVSALVVVDEAYFPFSRETLLPLVAERGNLMVTRTFSKAWGLAGVRVGMVAGNPEVLRTLSKVRSVYDITALGAHCLRVLLAHPEVPERYVADVDSGRELLVGRARKLGLEPIECPTNFLPIRVAARIPPAELVSTLSERGYLVKGPFAAPCMRDCVRVTLGPPDLMARFADALADALAS